MPIDTRDWYRDKPIYWTNSPPPRRTYGGGSGSGKGRRRFWTVVAVLAALVGACVLAATPADGSGILPGSPLYFAKTFGRDVLYAFTFDSGAKSDLTLKYADEDVHGIRIMCALGNNAEVAQLCFAYQDDFFNSMAWAVKFEQAGGDARALWLNLIAAHHAHRLVLADALGMVEGNAAEAIVGAVAYTASPLEYVIRQLEGPAEAALFRSDLQADFASVSPELWASIKSRLQFDTDESPDAAADSSADTSAEEVPPEAPPQSEPAPPQDERDEAPTDSFDAQTGRYEQYYLGLFYTTEGVLSGGCYGQFVVLINNESAHDPTYKELLAFLKKDDTDKYPYTYNLWMPGVYYGDAEDGIDMGHLTDIVEGRAQPSDPEICADFAERLHNNAELAGIRTGYVSIDLEGYPDTQGYGIPSDAGHALNVFETTDRGRVFIDCTGISGDGPYHNDAVVDPVRIGAEYVPDLLFDTEGWYTLSMGEVTGVEITWDGEWRP
ncbi:MAG: DUF5667 domain-containing protein [Dehalococcoidia bacterium]|nr:DUF5667 domain-containing protein [Dehalococcoidia bacterium]